jgi:hypothetical protein
VSVSEGASSGNVKRMLDELVNDARAELAGQGFTQVIGHFATPEDAWQGTSAFIGTDDAVDAPVEVIGNFVIPRRTARPVGTSRLCTSTSVCHSLLWRMQMWRIGRPYMSQPRRRRHTH